MSLSFKLPTNEKVSFVFENTASMKVTNNFAHSVFDVVL